MVFRAGRRGIEISERTSPLNWLRGQASVDDGYIVLRAADAEEYTYEGDHDLLHALCAIESEADAVRFVARHGLLWNPSELEDGVPDWITARQFLVFTEPLSAWQELAARLNHLVRRYSHLQWAANDDRYSLDWLRNHHTGFLLTPDEIEHATPDQLVFDVATHIATETSGGLAEEHGLFLVTLSSVRRRFMLFPIAPTLAGHAWLQLATNVVEHLDVRACRECERHFVARDPRQIYCSDRCAGRARSRRFRATRRAQPRRRDT